MRGRLFSVGEWQGREAGWGRGQQTCRSAEVKWEGGRERERVTERRMRRMYM